MLRAATTLLSPFCAPLQSSYLRPSLLPVFCIYRQLSHNRILQNFDDRGIMASLKRASMDGSLDQPQLKKPKLPANEDPSSSTLPDPDNARPEISGISGGTTSQEDPIRRVNESDNDDRDRIMENQRTEPPRRRGFNAGAEKGKEKEGKKHVRRGRRGTRNDASGERESSIVHDGPKTPRLPKRQCALLIGFCGSGYSGMQIQPDHTRTIEGTLFQAMVRAGAVSQDNADDPVKIGLARAARTDAGVHAAGNLVSLKMITSVPDVPDIVARINGELPPEIRVWGYVRVQNSFNARLICDSRKYTYFLPSYLLIPPKPGSGLEKTLRQYAAVHSPVQSSDVNSDVDSFWLTGESSTQEEDLARKRGWRIGPERIEKLKAAAQKFEGTHNFHNFTVGRDFRDRSNQRHMKKIEITEPVVYGETEWISVLFHGQSFMLHQIRKMMASLVLSCRTETPNQIIDELYGPRVVFIPKMPSLGLLLEEPIFDSYNTRMATVNEKLQPSDPDYRPPISFEAHRDGINIFKQKFIYNNMREVEDRTALFDAWIQAVDSYAGNDLLYLNPKGTIPQGATIKKGERRENPFREKKKFDATSFAIDNITSKLMDEEDEDEAPPIDKRDLADTEG